MRGNLERVRIQLDDRTQLNRVESPDAIDVVRHEVGRAVATRVEVRLELRRRGFENEPVEATAQLRRHPGQRLFERAEIEGTSWRQGHDRRRLRGGGLPGRAVCQERAHRALDDRPPVQPTHVSPFASRLPF